MEQLENLMSDVYGYSDSRNKSNDEYVFQPKIELNKETHESRGVLMSDTYIYVEAMPMKSIMDERNRQRIYKDKKALLVIRSSKVLKNVTHILVSVLLTPGITFWWPEHADYCLKFAIGLSVKELKFHPGAQQSWAPAGRRAATTQRDPTAPGMKAVLEGTAGEKLAALFEAYYIIPDVHTHFRAGTAYKGFVTTFAATLKQAMGWVVTIAFEETLETPIKVIISGKEPELTDFTRKGNYQLIGVGDSFIASANLPRLRLNDTIIYISIVPVVSNCYVII